MSEKGPGINTGKDIEPGKTLETKHTVKDSWFNAYIEGNATVPQTGKGIDIYLADAVLRDLPTNWLAFNESEFSPQQVLRISETMSRIHASLRIPHATQHQQHYFKDQLTTKLVSEGRLQELWRAARNGLVANLYLSLIPMGEHRIDVPNSFVLDSFFKDPINQDKIARLTEILKIIRAGLKDEKIQELIKIYREGVAKYHANLNELTQFSIELKKLVLIKLESQGLKTNDPFVKRVTDNFIAT